MNSRRGSHSDLLSNFSQPSKFRVTRFQKQHACATRRGRARLRSVGTAAAKNPTSPTPILDRAVPIPSPRKRGTGWPLFWFLLGLTVVVINLVWQWPPLHSIGRWITREFPQILVSSSTGGQIILQGLEVLLSPFLMLVLVLAIHEAAHVLLGICAGFSFSSLRISRLQIDRPFRISIYRGKGTGASGWASMFPVRKDRLAPRAAAMIFAGPAANLLTGIVVLTVPFSRGFFSFWFVLYSLLIGFGNLIPFRSRAMLSDGMRILMLLRSRERGERWVAIMKLGAELKEGVPPEDLSPDFLAKAIAIRDNSPDTVSAYAVAYAAAYFQHDDAKAAEYLETCLQYSSCAAPIIRQGLASDAGVFQARKRKRVDLAEQWLADLPGKTEMPGLRPRVEAAILEAKGDIEGALKKLDAVEKLVLAAPNKAQREISHRFLLKWKSELLPQPVATTPTEGKDQ